MHKVSIEQWRMFVAVVEAGGFAAAGDTLFKTQTAISHGIKKLEQNLNKPLFEIKGRRAELTSFGHSLLPAARQLIGSAEQLERQAVSQPDLLRKQLSIALDILYPVTTFYAAAKQFSVLYPDYNLDIHQTCLSRAAELLEDGKVQFAIASRLPAGCISHSVYDAHLMLVCHAQHPLSGIKQLQLNDLKASTQVVIRDAGVRRVVDSGWLGCPNRFIVADMQQALQAVLAQCGFAWLPCWLAEPYVQNQQLCALQLEQGHKRVVQLQFGYYENEANNQALHKLIALLDSH
ncbi:LysR family transcriptional regulator [Neptunicella marina]|uniref:LysR family transcriptional regulator n=1 Tax=Neptunicella marina TaxID=2125989 RepID=A0A8J6IX82_9ALTE|nr:LysR family transcriptional regulator [Neptunicella marina]MBC3767297.1 LysR family transcriptional regulator [Neptunicella marina]